MTDARPRAHSEGKYVNATHKLFDLAGRLSKKNPKLSKKLSDVAADIVDSHESRHGYNLTMTDVRKFVRGAIRDLRMEALKVERQSSLKECAAAREKCKDEEFPIKVAKRGRESR